MAITPNIGDVYTRLGGGGTTDSTRPGMPGAGRPKPYSPIVGPKGKQRKPSLDVRPRKRREFDFSLPFEKFNAKYLTPSYTPFELVQLAPLGYVGAIDKGKSTLLTMVAPEYRVQEALSDLRADRAPDPYISRAMTNAAGTRGPNILGSILDIARQPTEGDVKGYLDRTLYFQDKYGATGEKYASRWGMPSTKSKFAELYAPAAQQLRDEFVSSYREDNIRATMAVRQEALADELASWGQAVVNQALASVPEGLEESQAVRALEAAGMEAAVTADKLRPLRKDGKLRFDQKKYAQLVGQMQAIAEIDSENNNLIGQVEEALVSLQDEQMREDLRSNPGWSLLKYFGAGGAIGLPGGAGVASILANTPESLDNKALDFMMASARVSERNLLATQVSETRDPTGWMVNIPRNTPREIAAIGFGMPMAFVEILDSIAETGKNLSRGVRGEGFKKDDSTYYGIDTRIVDALKEDYSMRYWDPFFNPETREEGDSALDAFGKAIEKNPVMFALDLFALVPFIGWAIKGSTAFTTLGRYGKAGRVGGETDLGTLARTNAEKVLEGVDTGVALSAREYLTPRGAADPIRRTERRDPYKDRDEGTIFVGDEVSVEAPWLDIQGLSSAQANDLAQAVSVTERFLQKEGAIGKGRNYRRLMRKAIADDPLALRTVRELRMTGYWNIPDVNQAPGVYRLAAKFEPRYRVLENGRAIGDTASGKIIATQRLPGSPAARGIKQGVTWFARTIDEKSPITTGELGRRIQDAGFDKFGKAIEESKSKTLEFLVEFPHRPYRFQYTRALYSAARTMHGDLHTEGMLSLLTQKASSESLISPSMERALIVHLTGGQSRSLEFPEVGNPIYQRKLIEDRKTESVTKLEELDATVAGLEQQLSGSALRNNAEYRRAQADRKVLRENIDKEDAKLAALPEQEAYINDYSMLEAKIAQPHKTFAPDVEAAYALYQRMLRITERKRRLIDGSDGPATALYLKTLFAESMEALKINEAALFGAAKSPGELTPYVGRFAEVDQNFAWRQVLETENPDLAWTNVFDGNEGNVFARPGIVDVEAKKQSFADFIRATDRDGVLRDASGPEGSWGMPLMVLARGEAGKGAFVRVHVPRLSVAGVDEAGLLRRNPLVNESEVFVVPREVLSFSKANKAVRRLETEPTRNRVNEGVLNAMGEYFPTANFFSDKVAEIGYKGLADNWQDLPNEHVISRAGLKEYSNRVWILSQYNYIRHRFEMDLGGVLEANAYPVRLGDVRNRRVNGEILSTFRMFDDLDVAEAYARDRNLVNEFGEIIREDAKTGSAVAWDEFYSSQRPVGVVNFEGKRMYAIRGNVHDWFASMKREQMHGLSNFDEYRKALYTKLDDIDASDNTMVMLVPKRVDRALRKTVVEGNQYAQTLMSHKAFTMPTSIFKRLVLNFSPRFVSANVIGGTSMMMMYNPGQAPMILMRAMQHAARKAGYKPWQHIADEQGVLGYHMAYEVHNNVYSLDSVNLPMGAGTTKEGIQKLTDQKFLHKYFWNGGYTIVSAFEENLRKLVAREFLENDPGFRAFKFHPAVDEYIRKNKDYTGVTRSPDRPITRFEAAADLLLDPTSIYHQQFGGAQLKMNMRYTANTVSGNYFYFNAAEQLMRNAIMPFYSWQRHAAAFTWRLGVNRPVTTALLGQMGNQGYEKVLEMGLPSWMWQTVPTPEFIKDLFGIENADHRIDLNYVSPFGTVSEMFLAANQFFTGKDLGANVFDFANPFLKALVANQVGVDPQTGKPMDSGYINMVKDFTMKLPGVNIPRTTGSVAYDLVRGEYQRDAVANKYAVINNTTDIFKSYDPNNPDKPWKLSIPEYSAIEQPASVKEEFFNILFPLKPYSINAERMSGQAKREAVAAGAMNSVLTQSNANDADRIIKRVRDWQRYNEYVYQVWLPQAEREGLDPLMISLVLGQVEKQKPKRLPGNVTVEGVLAILNQGR